MTNEKLIEILSLPSDELIKTLVEKTNVSVPKWSDLEKQYDSTKHSIWDTIKYPAKLNDNNQDDFKRTALSLQELAVNRLAQSMFATPVKRNYTYDKESENAQLAVGIIEDLYKVRNYIDSENIERAKNLNKCCQVCTVWYVLERQQVINNIPTKFKLTHKSYCEADGYLLYPVFNEYDELLVISINYTDSADVEYFEVFTNTETPQYLRYVKSDSGWLLDTDKSTVLEIFPVIYIHSKMPAWGGVAGTNLVEQLEEMESYDGMYIKRNALPTFTLDYGDITGMTQITTDEKSDAVRNIIKVGKGGHISDVTWTGAKDSLTNRYNRIRNSFFEQIQIPDTSFANMIQSNTSSENKELIFADAKSKAHDVGGEWERFFYDELQIVKQYAKILFPSLSAEFDSISVNCNIIPYSIKTRKENAEYVSLAATAMSLPTKVAILGEVTNVNDEVELIQSEQSQQSNFML